MHKLELN
jgi:hypothetical protein